MEDRQSANPGRVKITLDDGTVMFGTIERADEPTVAGTPLNKNTLFNNVNTERYGVNLPSEAFELIGRLWGTFALTADGWSANPDSEGYYTQEISIPGMRAEYYPTMIPVYSATETKDDEKAAVGVVDRIVTINGAIKAMAIDVPETSFEFMLVGV